MISLVGSACRIPTRVGRRAGAARRALRRARTPDRPGSSVGCSARSVPRPAVGQSPGNSLSRRGMAGGRHPRPRRLLGPRAQEVRRGRRRIQQHRRGPPDCGADSDTESPGKCTVQ